MFVFPWRLVVSDVSVIHPAAVSCAQAAAQLSGSAAARRNVAQERAYWLVSSGLPFVPLSVESFRRLVAPALTFLRSLADHAVQAGARPSLGAPSCWGRSRISAMPCAGAMHHWDIPACTPSRVRLAGPRCVASLAPQLMLFEVV
jgi:hypothetical protein